MLWRNYVRCAGWMLRCGFLITGLLALGGCYATPSSVPWSAATYSSGNVYIMKGSYSLLNFTAIVSPEGTFKKAGGIIVGHQFTLYRKSKEFEKIGEFSQNGMDNGPTYFDYFASKGTLVAWTEGHVQNLTDRVSASFNGPFISQYFDSNPGVPYLLLSNSEKNQFSVVNKITGAATPLKPSTVIFMGKAKDAHNNYYLNDYGSVIIRAERNDSGSMIVSAFDMVSEKTILEPQAVSASMLGSDRSTIKFCNVVNGVVIMVLSNPSGINGLQISAGNVSKKIQDNIDSLYEGGRVFQENPDTLVLLYEPRRTNSIGEQLVLNKYSLSAGQRLSSETIAIPDSLP